MFSSISDLEKRLSLATEGYQIAKARVEAEPYNQSARTIANTLLFRCAVLTREIRNRHQSTGLVIERKV